MAAVLDLLLSYKLASHFSGGETTQVQEIKMNILATEVICFKFTDVSDVY